MRVAAVQPVAELFISTATALWATTYSIDLALFNEFLLARLGDPPLNVAFSLTTGALPPAWSGFRPSGQTRSPR